MRLKNRDPQKARLGTLLNILAKFLLSNSCGEKIRKIDLKTTFLGLWEVAMSLKSQNLQTKYLKSLLNVDTKLQLSSLLWRKDRRGIAIFKVKKKETLISPLLSILGSSLLDTLCNFRSSIDWLEKEQFLRFHLLRILLPNLGATKFWLEAILTPEYLMTHQSKRIPQIRSILVCIELSK